MEPIEWAVVGGLIALAAYLSSCGENDATPDTAPDGASPPDSGYEADAHSDTAVDGDVRGADFFGDIKTFLDKFSDDSDGDEVSDAMDNCPDDPDKEEPGACGCGVSDTDTDGDLVPDCKDLCPKDDDKIDPGKCGCGIPDADTDSDGTPDCVDKCPSDPNKVEPGACGCGVLDTDTDGDLVCDPIDNCPTDPNPDQVDSNVDGKGDACDPNVHAVMSGIKAYDVDRYDADFDGADDTIAIYGTDVSGNTILLSCDMIVQSGALACQGEVTFDQETLTPITYLPQEGGGVALAGGTDGTPTGIRRIGDGPVPSIEYFNFSDITMIPEGTTLDVSWPGGIAAFGSKIFVSESNCPFDSDDACTAAGLVVGFNSDQSISPYPSIVTPAIEGQRLSAMATATIEHPICGGDSCNLLFALSAGKDGENAGISVHNLDDTEMLAEEWFPLIPTTYKTEAAPLPELNLIDAGRKALFSGIDIDLDGLHRPEISAWDLIDGGGSSVPIDNCVAPGAKVTDIAYDVDAEADGAQPSFTAYIVAGNRVLFIDVAKSPACCGYPGYVPMFEPLGYVELSSNARRAIAIGGSVYVATEDDKIIEIVEGPELELKPCE